LMTLPNLFVGIYIVNIVVVSSYLSTYLSLHRQGNGNILHRQGNGNILHRQGNGNKYCTDKKTEETKDYTSTKTKRSKENPSKTQNNLRKNETQLDVTF